MITFHVKGLVTCVSDGLGYRCQSSVVVDGSSETVGYVAYGKARIEIRPPNRSACAAVPEGSKWVPGGLAHSLVCQSHT